MSAPGNQAEENSRQLLSSQLAADLAAHFGRTEDKIRPLAAAVLDIFARRHLNISEAVPVCTNCQAKVEALAAASRERLAGELTAQAAEMRAQAEAGVGPFKETMEGLGLKV